MNLIRLTLLSLACLGLAACSAFRPGQGPDTAYKDAKSGEALVLPPELNSPQTSNRYVVPGTAGEPITQNTLLPVIDAARLVRAGDRAWLEINGAPEDVWGPLKGFLQHQGYRLATEEPNLGFMETTWLNKEGKPIGTAEGGFSLKGLLGRIAGDDDERHKYSLRLERSKRLSTRLFVVHTSERSYDDPAEAEREINKNSDERAKTLTERSVGNQEQEALLMQRFLVHMGIGEQRAAGILSDEQARNLVSVAYLENLHGRQTLVLKTSDRSAWRLSRNALENIGFSIARENAEQGTIQGQFERSTNRNDGGVSGELAGLVQQHYGYDRPVRFQLSNQGAISRLQVSGDRGQLMPRALEEGLMDALLNEIQ